MHLSEAWLKNAKLRIINGGQSIPSSGAWTTYNVNLQLNDLEEGWIVGFQHWGAAQANGRLSWQILYNDTSCHEGFFRSSLDNVTPVTIGNQQPVTMPMPPLYVPPSTLIGIRASFMGSVALTIYVDLYILCGYQLQPESREPVCFPSDGQPLESV